MEPGANGVLAHLSMAVVAGPLRTFPAELRRATLYVLTERTLDALSSSVEAVALAS